MTPQIRGLQDADPVPSVTSRDALTMPSLIARVSKDLSVRVAALGLLLRGGHVPVSFGGEVSRRCDG